MVWQIPGEKPQGPVIPAEFNAPTDFEQIQVLGLRATVRIDVPIDDIVSMRHAGNILAGLGQRLVVLADRHDMASRQKIINAWLDIYNTAKTVRASAKAARQENRARNKSSRS